MIQMADVGVGICGQEGRQAVMASDFAMGQFRFLKRLLLVHGHWNYRRIGYLVLYNFYRNAVFVLMLFWYELLLTLLFPVLWWWQHILIFLISACINIAYAQFHILKVCKLFYCVVSKFSWYWWLLLPCQFSCHTFFFGVCGMDFKI